LYNDTYRIIINIFDFLDMSTKNREGRL